MSPPAYHPYYCEENIFLLSQQERFARHKVWIVFISNPEQRCPMWAVRAAGSLEDYVIWDYHVVLFDEQSNEVWDLDSLVGCPLAPEGWIMASFRILEPPYQPMFRLVPKQLFLKYFRTDRSHMRKQGNWLAEPPPWQRPHTESNLANWCDMTQSYHGEVLDLQQLMTRWLARAD